MIDWEVLGIQPTTDERAIKRAYAKQTRIHHPETDPEGFQLVYNAYQRALQSAKSRNVQTISFNSDIVSEKDRNTDSEKQSISKKTINDNYKAYDNIENGIQDDLIKDSDLENDTEIKRRKKLEKKYEQYSENDLVRYSKKIKYVRSKDFIRKRHEITDSEKEIYESLKHKKTYHDLNKRNEFDENSDRQKINVQIPQEELLFSDLYNYVEQEKRKYYSSAALVEFIRIFSDSDRVYYPEPWRRYFESTTFLKAQYDKKFIKYLAEYLEQQQEIDIRKLPKNLFVELCTAYGIITDTEVYQFDFVNPLINIMYLNSLREDYSYMMTRKKDVVERRYAFYIYRSLLREYEKDASARSVSEWVHILEDVTHDVSQKADHLITISHSKYDEEYLMAGRIPLTFELITSFLEIKQPITKELHYAFYLLFEKQDIKNGGEELEIMLLTLQKLRSPDHQRYITSEEKKKESLDCLKNVKTAEAKSKSEFDTKNNKSIVILEGNNKNKPEIKKYSIGFIAYLVFIASFYWMTLLSIPIFILAIVFPEKLDSLDPLWVVGYVVLTLISAYFLFQFFPYMRSEKMVKKFVAKSSFSYWLRYNDDYWLVDEINGRFAVVTKKNPFRIQVMDASYLEKIAVYPDLNSNPISKLDKIGVEIRIFDTEYFAYTYNGISRRHTEYIGVNSGTARDALMDAQNLALSLTKAKKAAL